MKTLSIFLVIVALIAGMVGCAGADGDDGDGSYTLIVDFTTGGTVTVDDVPIPGKAILTYGPGTVVSLDAAPSAGYRFTKWTGNVSTIADTNAASTTITINDNYFVTASFIAQYTLTIDSTDGGEVTTPGEGTFTYDAGAVVDLVAEAEEGYKFLNWTGDIEMIANVTAVSTTINMEGDCALIGNFTPTYIHFAEVSFFDDSSIPSGVNGEVDNAIRRYRVVGTANPNTSRYVYFSSNPVPLADLTTTVFEAYVLLPTGLRTGILTGPDPCGDRGDNSMGTPVLFRIEFTPFTFAEISMQGAFGLALEQVINNEQPSDERSPNGGLATTYTAITKWLGDFADFDPLGLTPQRTVGAYFHIRLSIDFEQNKVMAEITPCADCMYAVNPITVTSQGTIDAPFVAVTNLIDYTTDPLFDGNLHFKIFVRTNGNAQVDSESAPGGTLRYIDREFTNVQVLLNAPIVFPSALHQN
jgi:hypothetical protein